MEMTLQSFQIILSAIGLIVIFGIFLLCIVLALSKRKGGGQSGSGEVIKFENLSEKFAKRKQELLMKLGDKEELKELKKQQKEVDKSKEKKGRVYFIDFEGDMKASQVKQLKKQVNTILQVVKKEDEVVVGVTSGGGLVSPYGLGASQLQRIKDAGIELTCCVDTVAASGGYMMASVAPKILAAPFAVVGSIGVVATVPNIHKLLKKNDVDVHMVTAGKYKRTLTLLGENTEEGEQKFKEELTEVHTLFKDHVVTHRPNLNLEEVATGEYWYGKKAQEMGLIDGIQTSDGLLMEKMKTHTVYQVKVEKKEGVLGSLRKQATLLIEKTLYNSGNPWF